MKCDKDFLDELADKYNCSDFIADDPISIPHRYESRNDREIAGFLAATIAWGNRKAIVKNASRMMSLLDDDPYRFVVDCTDKEMLHLGDFVHRTFNGGDLIYFITALKNIYKNHGGIGVFFEKSYAESGDIRVSLAEFHKLFFEIDHPQRVRKHLSSIERGAACKRLNMYIKWMVRRDKNGVDFGLWNIPASALYLPLDVHSGNIGRQLGLLTRTQNDWKAVEQITAALREFDSEDPVKYDYALFGAGVNNYFKDNE
ncbi:MAG: TIGR02757 family protein [Rikenellaceae bacterium]